MKKSYRADPRLIWLACVLAAAALIIYLAKWSPAEARDLGQWKYASPDMAAYFAGLKQPDHPGVSCCGEADAYWADKTESGPNGETIAIITDTRDDAPLKRPHIDVGTRIPVPPEKMRRPAITNPTDHTIIFIGGSERFLWVYCYEPSAGI